MAAHPPSAAAAPLLRRTGRLAFPTPRGATGGCPPDTVCGGRPRDPRGDGKCDPKGGGARLPDVVVWAQFS